MGRFVKYQTMTQKIAREILTDADFGWMSVDERRLFLAVIGLEEDACYYGKKFMWSVSPGCSFAIFCVSRRKTGRHKVYWPSRLCKTWWKRWILKFLHLEWMP